MALNYPDKNMTSAHDRPRLLQSIGQNAGVKVPCIGLDQRMFKFVCKCLEDAVGRRLLR